MTRTPKRIPVRGIQLTASADWVPCGHSVSLAWEVPGLDGDNPSIQLACAGENGMQVIESVPRQGTRQVIFARPDVYAFTLTATFSEGVKRHKQIRIRVIN